MSPLSMALLGLLAFKAIRGFTSGQPAGNPSGGPAPSPGAGSTGGGLGNLLQSGLGGLLAGGAGGAAAGSVLSGGLSDLLKQFQQSGHGETANSWVGNGPNKTIAPNDLANALGADKINALMDQSGMSREELLSGLSQNLPEVVDQLTPNGRLPSAEEAARLL
jgi:uncharacterized protein YidB (DUF937 family)